MYKMADRKTVFYSFKITKQKVGTIHNNYYIYIASKIINRVMPITNSSYNDLNFQVPM